MKLSVITDEIGQDVEFAADFAVRHGVTHVAIRSGWGQNIADMDLATVGKLAEVMRRRDLRISSVLSPLFKCNLPGTRGTELSDPHFVGFPTDIDKHLGVVDHLHTVAGILGAPVVRVFTFLKDASPTDPTGSAATFLIDAVRSWPDHLAGVENEHTCGVATLAELEDFCRQTGMSAVVDPCNQRRVTGAVSPADLTCALVARTVDVHVKDVRDERYVPVGTGLVDWNGLLGRLQSLGYAGYITLESHLRGDLDGVAASLSALRGWLPE